MSRVRTRPTRDDTRDKLFEAAAQVFEEKGIGGASIEAAVSAAVLSDAALRLPEIARIRGMSLRE